MEDARPMEGAKQIGKAAWKPDPLLAPETFGTTRACRICKRTLSKYNPEPVCGPCDREHGPFDSDHDYSSPRFGDTARVSEKRRAEGSTRRGKR